MLLKTRENEHPTRHTRILHACGGDILHHFDDKLSAHSSHNTEQIINAFGSDSQKALTSTQSGTVSTLMLSR